MKQKLKIHKTKWGIASRIGNEIYINEKIKEDSKLFKDLIDHEKSHSSGWNLGDLKLDMKNQAVRNNRKEYYGFVAKNPKALTQFLPFYKKDGEIIIDPMLCAVWFVCVIFGALILLKIGSKFI